jgi:hypothetical protein
MLWPRLGRYGVEAVIYGEVWGVLCPPRIHLYLVLRRKLFENFLSSNAASGTSVQAAGLAGGLSFPGYFWPVWAITLTLQPNCQPFR